MNRDHLWALARLSLLRPIEGGQAILRLDIDRASRWIVLVVAIVLGVLAAFVLPLLLGAASQFPSPMVVLGAQLGVNVAAIGLITGVGRLFGGTGRFDDAVLLMGAFQGIMLILQVAQLVVALVLPALAFVVATFTVGVFLWVLTGFICALHGFQSQVLVLLGAFATLIAASFVMVSILVMMGVDVPGMPADV